jgi:hypothetical protein
VKRRYLRRDPFWQRYLPSELVRVTANLDELDHAIAAFRAAGIRTIAVLGGDGTLHGLIDAVLREYAEEVTPAVLALAGGTMNGGPRALGTGGKPEGVLRQALLDLAAGTPHLRRRHVLRVVDGRDGQTRHGLSFATGLVARAFQQYYRTPDPGWIAAIGASFLPVRSALFGGPFYDDISLQVIVQGAPWLDEAPHTVVASVFHNPLLWFQPFGAPLEDGTVFHFGATSMRPREIAPRLWSIFRGTCRHPRLRVGPARDVVVRGDAIGYLIDGELYSTERGCDVRLTAGPQIPFVTPGR